MPSDKEKNAASSLKDAMEGWKLLRCGEMKGLEMVYQVYVDEMYRYGMGIHPNEAFVKDCIQEVFISLWKYRSQLKETEHIKAYLFRSLGNRIRREIGQYVATYPSLGVDDEMQVGWVDSVEKQLLKEQSDQELNQKLSNALNRLPDRQKEAIQLVFFQQLSYEQVSTEMNLQLRSVYTLVWKAIATLKKNMLSWLPALFPFIG
ncbi:MAG TPA: sigma-70 family RNA polymerase sigma factor [Cyclobacteriaceae bacterium]|nr:sigma-70 family RNA polymerase sigma factor [Cyclobacteriaceae bacterium]